MSKKIFIFLSIALFLYLFDWLLNGDDENIIYVSDNDIDFLVSTWNDQMQNPPNKKELKTIIENFIQNEALYREALKLNLERGDIIVKRRLVQKLGFLKQEEGVKIPNDSELKKYFDENKGEFRIPKRLSFNHIFFSKESRSLEEVRRYLVNKSVKSDPFLLGRNFSDKTIRQIQRDFGDKFASSLDKLTTLKKNLIIESIYGWHVVNVSNIEDSYLPEFNSIKDKLLDTYLLVKKDEVLKKYTEDLIKSYDVSLSKKYSFE
jgi:hypothetical protein